jgi:hypothetical protein
VLATTRDDRIGKRLAPKETIKIPPPSEGDAVEMLLSQLVGDWDRTDMARLVTELDYLPLAITQAAAFINENYISINRYIEMYIAEGPAIKDMLDMEQFDGRRDFESASSVVRTWSLSLVQLSRQKKRAAEMLSLNSGTVPESLLRKEGELELEFVTALGTLQAFSLVNMEKNGAVFEVHRLVQLSTRIWLEHEETLIEWQEQALSLLCERFPSGEHKNWTTCEELSPHALAVSRYYPETESS